MSVSISHEPRPTEWITLNGVAVNLAQVTSIAFSPQTGVPQGGVLAVVYLPSFNPGRSDPPNTTSFEITDGALADRLRSYVESRRFKP
jgi:hypothetical protein